MIIYIFFKKRGKKLKFKSNIMHVYIFLNITDYILQVRSLFIIIYFYWKLFYKNL